MLITRVYLPLTAGSRSSEREMHFRITTEVRGLVVHPLRNHSFVVNGDPATTVDLWFGELNDVHIETTPLEASAVFSHVPRTFCMATYEREPSADIGHILDALAEGQLPEGSIKPAEGWPDYIEEDGTIQQDHYVSQDLLPQSLQEYCDDVIRELVDAANRVIELIAWRYNVPIAHPPVGELALVWSREPFDGPSGRRSIMPSSTRIGWRWFPPPYDVTHPLISDLLRQGADEPLGHELFREAWHQRHANPRSALLIGIAAAEVGCKQCLITLAPDTRAYLQTYSQSRMAAMTTIAR